MEKKWIIHQLERKSDNGFVVRVHWRYQIKEIIDNNEYFADTYSVIQYEQETDNYIPFNEITEDIVIDWIKTSLGEEELTNIENSLLTQIELQKNPPIEYGLPWDNINDSVSGDTLTNI